MKIIHRNEAVHTSHSRDAALRRLRGVNRWLLAGSAALTGVLTDVAANAFPGHSKRAAAPSAKPHHSSSKALKPPPQAPRPATTARHTTPAPAPAPAEPAEPAAPAESSSPAPAEETPAPAPEAQSETAAPEARREAPAPEPSEPVVSGGS
jgi:hypothetical protein